MPSVWDSHQYHNPRTRDGAALNEQTGKELAALGGADRIPFLVDHQREATMYESDESVTYLDEHYA